MGNPYSSRQDQSQPARFVHMFVLGVDPGLTRCGYAVVEPRPGGKGRARALGVIRTPPSTETPYRLWEIQRELRSLIEQYRPTVVAIEKVFFQKNTISATGVAQVVGLVLVEAVASGAAAVQYTPTEVKAVVAGDGRADKGQVQAMVQMLLGLATVPRPADAADAAALALCHLAYDPTLRSVRTEGTKL